MYIYIIIRNPFEYNMKYKLIKYLMVLIQYTIYPKNFFFFTMKTFMNGLTKITYSSDYNYKFNEIMFH